MKKAIMIFVVGLFLTVGAVSLFAAGGKNHGEVGEGAVIQHQECVDDKGTPSF